MARANHLFVDLGTRKTTTFTQGISREENAGMLNGKTIRTRVRDLRMIVNRYFIRTWSAAHSGLMWEVPHYDRGGLYFQSAFLIGCWAFWILWPAFMGRSIETGFAIAALGLAAVVMTVRADQLSKVEKVIWVMIGFVLFVAEVHVIDQDRIEQDKQHRTEMQHQEQQFERTMGEFSKTNKDEAGHFGKLLGREDGIFKGMQKDTRATVDALTGGDSYAAVMPVWTSNSSDPEFPLMIFVTGKNTMYDVNIEMQEGPIDVQYMASHFKEYLEGKVRSAYHFPSLSTTYSAPLGKEIHPDPKKINEYNFWVFSRTKPSRESLEVKFDQDKKHWIMAFEIFRGDGTRPILTMDFDGKRTTRHQK